MSSNGDWQKIKTNIVTVKKNRITYSCKIGKVITIYRQVII